MKATAIANTGILQFPKDRIVRAKIPEEYQHRQIEQHKQFLNVVTDQETAELFTRLMMAGLNVQDEKFQRKFVLITEFTRATIFESGGLDHPLIKVMDKALATIKELVNQRQEALEVDEEDLTTDEE